MNKLIEPVYNLLEDPNRWTKQAVAKNSKGMPCCATNVDAVCWCLMGAVLKSYPYPVTVKFKECCALLGDDFICFNDKQTTTHKDVLDRLKAIPE